MIRNWEELDTKKPEIFKKAFADLGLDVEVEATAYGSIRECLIRAKNGKTLRISSAPTISKLKVPTEKLHVVKGTLYGASIYKTFKTHDEAYTFKDTVDSSAPSDSRNLVLTEEEIEIEGDLK